MARKPVLEGGKKDEIVKAALELFMEKGYEGTSIRMIQSKVHSEVGLFYYYFKNKDEVFEVAIDLFFANYKKQLKQIVEDGRRNPCRALSIFFDYMETEVANFRGVYKQNLHWTILRSIREHTLTVIEPYLREILDILVQYGARPRFDLDVVNMFLTHGVGSIVLHGDSELYTKKHTDIVKTVNMIMGMSPDEEFLLPVLANLEDIPAWMRLLNQVEKYFPGLDKEAYQAGLEERIGLGEAYVIRSHDELVGAIVYSRENQTIDFLARNPEFAKKAVGRKLLETAIAQFPVGTRISVVTYRDGDALGEAARKLYHRFGFEDGELIEVFDYPCECMYLTIREPDIGRSVELREN